MSKKKRWGHTHGRESTPERKRKDAAGTERAEVTRALSLGTIDGALDIGVSMGYWRHWPAARGLAKAQIRAKGIHSRPPSRSVIRLAGIVRIGPLNYLAGVVPGSRWVFLSQNGKVWRVEPTSRKYVLPAACPAVAMLDEPATRLWGASLVRTIEDALCPAPMVAAVVKGGERYRDAVYTHVQRRVAEARQLNRQLKTMDIARAVNPAWDFHTLTAPRHPTVQHAVYLSLALALSLDEGAELIELAAMCEYRAPLVGPAAARSMYQQSAHALAQLVPAWHNHGYLTDWRVLGSITQAFNAQYTRTILNVDSLGVDLTSMYGLIRAPADLTGYLGEDPLDDPLGEE
mgnify:FL=1